MSSSIGVFGEGEIDGKPFHIFTFLSQTQFPTSSSDNNLSLRPLSLFLCPKLRLENEMLNRKESGYSTDDDVLPFSTSPQIQHLFDPDTHGGETCKLAQYNPQYSPHDESYNWNMPKSISCDACLSSCLRDYFCLKCNRNFHRECLEAPLEIKHPSYPFLSLRLYTPTDSIPRWKCFSCKKRIYNLAYHCPTYNIRMHTFCAMKPVPILIDHKKRHPHSLTFFPKQNSLLCNVCGVIEALIPTYVCARCVFVVHQDCIYFPYVIRISRHHHRISFTFSLPSGKLSCGVCRKKVDNSCGAYSCNKCEDYFVHSRCALRKDVWDGKELEGVPEEDEIVVDPYEKIADGIILHVFHGHQLKLELSRVYDEDKLCQACVLPIYEGNYYSCMDKCDFILHETCADSPLKKHHPLHAHPLTLKSCTSHYPNSNHFTCDACYRPSSGFVYETSTSRFRGFKLDLRCASVSEPFKYEGHEHPLYLALTPKEEKSAICQICKYNDGRKLNCIECDYIICFSCATLPRKARYKHDKHFLTFRETKEAGDQLSWCEVCEKQIEYAKEIGFYSCDDYCCTTLHVDCLLGREPYMKTGDIFVAENEASFHIRRNNSMSRPHCYRRKCDNERCLYKVFFEKENYSDENENRIFCSYYCACGGYK